MEVGLEGVGGMQGRESGGRSTFFFFNLKKNLFIFGCVGSSLLRAGFL